MAQLNYEWQELSSVYAGNTGYGDVYLNLMGVLVSQDTSSNKSRVGLGLRIYTSNGSWSSQMNDTLDGNYQDLGYRTFNAGHEFIHIIEKDISHNSDGTGSGNFNGSIWSYFFGTTSGSASFTLPTIPRYASITSFSVSKRDETSVTFNWKANATIDYVWYSTNDGSSWTGYNTPDGTSGSFTVSGLSANTTYNFKIRVRRKDSQLNTTSSRVQQTTYNYPNCSSASNFTIGNNIPISLYNPLGRTVSINIYGDDNSLICSASRNINGSTEIGSNASEIESQYASIPNKASGTYKVDVIYGSITKTKSNAGTYTINANECIPTFEDFEYSTDLSNLTGDNDTIINGKTTTTFTVSTTNKATAKNYATISKYRFECGSYTDEANESESAITKALANCNDAIIKVTAIDSRGVEKTVSKTIGNFKNYVGPSISSIQVERKDGVDAETNLDFVVNYWNYSFGSVTNEITEVAYRVKQSSSSTWSEWYDDINVSHITYSDDKATLTDELIHENGSSGGFTIGTQFDIQVKISDGNSSYILSSVESNILTLTDGQVAFSVNKDSNGNYHTGVDEMPDENYSINTKSMNVSVNAFKNGKPLVTVDDIYPVGSIYLTVGNESPANLFGGTWTKMSGGYLYGCASSIDNSSYTGIGTQSTAISSSQLPKLTGQFRTTGNIVTNVSNADTFFDNSGIFSRIKSNIARSNTSANVVNANTYNGISVSIGSGQGHSHNVAYIGVWVWKRTA